MLMFKNRYVLVLSIIIILVAGLSAFTNLPRLEDPKITNRSPTIITFFPGASAARIEALITKPIEDALRELHEVKTIESTSRDGVSFIFAELQDWTDNSNNQEIFAKMRARLEDAARSFPEGSGKPIFDEMRNGGAFTMITAISIPQGAEEQINITSRLSAELADRLRNISGTEIVRVYGAPQEEISVEVDEAQIAALGLSNSDIAALITQADSKNSAGALRSETRNLFIEVKGELDSLSRIADIPIKKTQSGGVLYLGDIATIKKTITSPENEIAFTEAENRSIYVAARMTANLRVGEWTARAQQVVDDFSAEFDASANINTIFTQNTYTQKRLGDLSMNLLLGVMVVMIVVLISMGWKPALIVGLALPLSMASALFSLSFFGQQIHQMTIFGMIIAIGLLIDNAIVMTDEIRKNIRLHGLSAQKALTKSINHLKVPLFASTLTTILGFMPIFLLPGNIGDFVGPIALSVVLALAFSLVISLTIIPTLAAIFTKPENDKTKRWWRSGISSEKLASGYQLLLKYALTRPKRAILAALILPITGIVLSGSLPNEFFPSADRDQFEIQVWLSEDTALAKTEHVARAMDAIITEKAGVRKTAWLVGGSIPSIYYNQIMDKDQYPSYAHSVVFTDSVADAGRLIPELQQEFDEKFPEARIIVRAFAQGPPVTSPVSFRISGQNIDTLRKIGEDIRLILENQSGVSHSFASIEGGKPKLWFDADENKVRLAGLSLNEVAQQFQTQLEGVTGGTVLEDLQALPVRIRNTNETRGDLVKISSLKINTPETDGWVPVSALGELVLKPEVTGITRRNGERVNTIGAFLEAAVAPIDVTNAVLKEIEDSGYQFPAGYKLHIAGDADAQNEAVGQLLTFAPVLGLLMVATLILSFKSVLLAAVIATVAFLSAGLGFLALVISGLPLGFNPLIGTAGLIGVAINGSIVVLAAIRANSEAAAGSINEIIIETMGTGRHILSTTFTTVAGFMPLLIGGGTFWPPLAIVIAGGVGFSVILSLFFTPAVYVLFHKRKEALA